MKIQHNIKSYSITWLANTYDKENSTGVVENYYQPETLDEFVDLCKDFYARKESFKLIGHTSNIYILPKTNIKNLVSTKYLNRWHSENGFCYCECGTSVMHLVKSMIERGVEGYACMVDLPGTVGAALYGNAGVSHDSIAKVLKSVSILTPDGLIKDYSYDDMNFDVRSSALKRSEFEGVIVSCCLYEKFGDPQRIKKEAENVHRWRIENQPGPSKNLGTTSLLTIVPISKYGYLVKAVAKICSLFVPKSKRKQVKLFVIFSLFGHKSLLPYIEGLNKYMWNDKDAHNHFDEYVEFINKMYKNPRLEIEVW